MKFLDDFSPSTLDRDFFSRPTYKFLFLAPQWRQTDCCSWSGGGKVDCVDFVPKKEPKRGKFGDSEQIIVLFFSYWIFSFQPGRHLGDRIVDLTFQKLKLIKAWKTHKVPRTVGEENQFFTEITEKLSRFLWFAVFSGFAVLMLKQKRKKTSKVLRLRFAGNLLNLANFHTVVTFW